jgi:hypothetical protein
MSGKPSRIDKNKTDLPDRIGDVPTVDKSRLDKLPERAKKTVTEQVQTKKKRGLMDKLQSVKDRGFKAIGSLLLRWIINFIMDVFLSFGVHKKDAEGKPIPKIGEDGKPVKDKNGNPVYVISWGQTFITVLVKNRAEIAFLSSILGYQLFGASVLEWIERIVIALGI